MSGSASADERGGWQQMDCAPLDRPIEVETEEGQRFAVKRINVPIEDGDIATWAAVSENDHPPCWCDGIFWDSNSQGSASEPPVRWRELACAQGNGERDG